MQQMMSHFEQRRMRGLTENIFLEMLKKYPQFEFAMKKREKLHITRPKDIYLSYPERLITICRIWLCANRRAKKPADRSAILFFLQSSYNRCLLRV